MHFCIFFLHASIYSWKDSSRITLNFFISTLLLVVESLKWVPFNTPLKFGEEKKVTGLNPMSRVVAQHGNVIFG